MNTASDVVTYLAIAMNAAGDPLTQPRALALGYLVQAWTLAILGKPAFPNRILVGQGAPVLEGIGRSNTHYLTPDPYPRQERVGDEIRTIQPYDLTPDIQAVCDLVLRDYSGLAPYALQQIIINDPPYIEGAPQPSGNNPGVLITRLGTCWSSKPKPAGADQIKPYVAPPPPPPEAPKSRHANGMTEEEHERRAAENSYRTVSRSVSSEDLKSGAVVM